MLTKVSTISLAPSAHPCHSFSSHVFTSLSFCSFTWALCLAAAAAKSLQSCPTLCDPIGSSPPGSPVPGILQARTLEWVATAFSNAWKWKVKVKSLSRIRLSDPMDCSLPGSSVHGIFQARVLEWSAIAFSKCFSSLCNLSFPIHHFNSFCLVI